MHVELRIKNTDLSAVLKTYTDRRLRFALSRFGGRVRSVVVVISEIRDVAHGILKRCHINVEIKPFGQVAAREEDPNLYTAIDRAVGRVGRLCASRLGREVAELGMPLSGATTTERKSEVTSGKRSRVARERLPKRGHARRKGGQENRSAIAEFAGSDSNTHEEE